MLPTNGLYGHIQKNTLKSALLLVGFVVLIVLFWTAWCVIYSAIVDHWWFAKPVTTYTRQPPVTFAAVFATGFGRALTWWWMPLFLSSCWFVVAYLCYADIIRASTGAREITRREQPRLYNLVEKTSITAGLPMPRVEIMRTGALNAYAAGLSPENAVIAVTQGLLQKLDDAELEAVIAHEMTHIKNRDVRLMVIAAVFAGGLTLIGSAVSSMISNGSGGDVAAGAAEGAAYGVISGDGDGESLPVVIGSILIGILFLCLAHLFAILIYFAMSRSREFLADAGAVEITKDADAMISALNKISNDDEEVPGLSMNMRAMMISASAESLFSTHPSIGERVSALQAHAGGRSSMAQRVGRVATLAAATWGGRAGGGAVATSTGAVGFGRRAAPTKPMAR